MHADPIPGPDFVTKARIGRGLGWGVAGGVFLVMAALLYLGGDAAMKTHENLWLALGVLFCVIACATGLAARIEVRLMDIQREIVRTNQLRFEDAAKRQSALDTARKDMPIP
jgi:type VI protein secretion system component VasK